MLVEGEGTVYPDENDRVSVHFVGWTPAGAMFTNSLERGQPGVFDLDQVFPGWREGLGKMVQGEVRRLWIPEHLAPSKPGSGPRGEVVFDVELMAVLKMPPVPEDLTSPPAGGERTASGVRTKVLDDGIGERKPGPEDRVLVIYTGWTRDGKVFDSSLWRFRPTMFMLDKVMPAFADGLRLMVEGEKRRFWVPGAVAGGQWVGQPQGDLVFDVQLVQIF